MLKRASRIPARYVAADNDTEKDYENIDLISTSSIDTNTQTFNHQNQHKMEPYESYDEPPQAHHNHHFDSNTYRNPALVHQSLESFSESDSGSSMTPTESVTVTQTTSAPNIKVIPIAIKQTAPHQAMPIAYPSPPQKTTTSATDLSTVSTIEDMLAEKVERIASHLEAANNNILNVDGKIKHFRNENITKNQDNYDVLNNLKSQIDQSLQQQNQVHNRLSKSIKRLDKTMLTGPKSGPVILPQSNYHAVDAQGFHQTYPLPSSGHGLGAEHQTAAAVMEDTKSFLTRIRREADQRVSEAIKSAEKEQEHDSTIDRLKNFLDQQNKESNIKAQQQAAEIAAEQEKRKYLAHSQKKELESVKNNFQTEINFYKKERENLNSNLNDSKKEISSLKFELDSLRKSFDDISKNERRKFDELEKQSLASHNYNYQNLNEIGILKGTIDRLNSEKADLENKVWKKREENDRLREEQKAELQQISEKYEKEIEMYKNEYSSHLDHIEMQGEKSERSMKDELAHYRQENAHLKRQLGLLGHELSERDIAADQLKILLTQAKEDLRKASFPNEKLILSNRKFLVSISTILKDLQSKEGSGNMDDDATTNLPEDFLSKDSDIDDLDRHTNSILNRLAKAVERVNLAEKLKSKAEDDRQELKNKVRDLLEKIQKEKEMKIEKDNMMNEKAFQDTISVLQKELNRTRKQIRATKN